jgi:hypothetical protein
MSEAPEHIWAWVRATHDGPVRLWTPDWCEALTRRITTHYVTIEHAHALVREAVERMAAETGTPSGNISPETKPESGK